MSTSTLNLFTPLKIGQISVNNRVAFAPSTRFRTLDGHVIVPEAAEYYSQRGSVPGTLLVTEATFIAARASGYKYAPGIWSEDQISAWKKVTDAVHKNGSFIFLQLWALGRAAYPSDLEAEGGYPLVSASDIPLSAPEHAGVAPRPLTVAEIKEYVDLYAKAATNAIEAGFDGVEIHSANGYLLDQFLQDITNKRTDDYGGSIENRIRFPLEVAEAVTKAVGEGRSGLRISPWNTFQEMRMSDPKPTFAALASKLHEKYPKFAYLHIVEPRGDFSVAEDTVYAENVNNDFLSKIWGDRPLIRAGGFKRKAAIETAEKNPSHVIAFSRDFISNPDLPYRLEHDIPLNKYDRATFYAFGSGKDPKGYTDYPFSEKFLEGSKL